MRKILLLTAVLALLAPLALAQDGQFDPEKVDAILLYGVGIGGLTVTALTEMLKRMLKAQGALAYVISAVVSAAAVAAYLLVGGGWALIEQVIYTAAVFVTSNGIYKFTKKPSPV